MIKRKMYMYIHKCMIDKKYIKITVDRVSNYKSIICILEL